MADLREITEALDDYLRVDRVPDYPGAMNGLQVEGRSPIERVAAATDAALATIEAAVEREAQLLLVHHGLFWGDPRPVTGPTYRRFRALFDADMAVYSAHLPLDVHDEVGNNVLLADALELPVEGRFGTYEDLDGLGVWSAVDVSRDALVDRVVEACGGSPTVIPGGPSHVRRVGVVTGGADSMLGAANAAGLDTFITGEGKHHTYHEALELGLNVIYAGHYATETLGVRALAAWLGDRFGVDHVFLDHPTGL